MIPYAPDRQLYVPSTRAQDIILRQGEAAADSAARSGQIWGNALQDLGGIASGYVQDRAAQKEEQRRTDAMNKRENALFNLIGDGSKLPDYRDVRKVVGPEKADETYNTISSYFKLKNQPNAAKPEDVQRLGRWWLKASPEARAKSYPALRSAISPLFPGVPIPEQLTPEMEPQVEQFINSLTPPEKVGTKTVEVLNPDGSKTTKIVEDKPGQEFTSAAPPPTPKASVWVKRGGKLIPIQPGTEQPGDMPYEKPPASSVVDPAAVDDDVKTLLGGGTADKIPIKNRSAAVEAARQSGGVDGTGFVPMNNQQQTKYSDFMDLRSKAIRLRELLQDPEVSSKLGPLSGRWTSNTKELLGANTKVKEAFDLFGDLSDTELRKRSGAQISPNEYDRITGFTVSPNKEADSNLTNLNRMLNFMTQDLGRLGATKLPSVGGPDPSAPSSSSKPKIIQLPDGTWTRQ